MFNKPAYVVMCILDLSKTLMYHFHYSIIKDRYGKKARLLFMDTDNSLTYEIKTNDLYQDFYKNKDMFQTGMVSWSRFICPVTTGGFELRIYCIQSRYLTH